MNVFSVDFTPQELSILRQSLDTITLMGKDAKLIASIQIKLENEMQEIGRMLEEEENKKKEELEKIINSETQSKKILKG
jgi:DUF917 family protein